MEGLIPYVFKAVTRHKNRRYYENLYGQTSADASFLDSEHKWEGKQQQQQSHRHRRTMSLPSCLGQQHQIPIPAIMEQEKEEGDQNMKGCVGGGVMVIFGKGGSKSLRLPSRNQRS